MDVTAGRSSASIPTPAIFNLNDDLLLHIFHLNTYMPETEYSHHTTYSSSDPPRALTVARHTSQVCRAWRQTILGSPVIWGSLIDMTIFEKSRAYWVDEVLKRAGNSDLSVYGCVGRRAEPLFTFVLDKHWHRVRRLDIQLDTFLSHGMLDLFSGQPAPRLEKFLLESQLSRVINSSALTMFANSAPSLRRYHCPPIVHDIHRVTWLSQLSSLTLYRPLSTADIFRILGTTVHLESLFIMMVPEFSNPGIDWNKRYLPKLVRLHVGGAVSQCLLFLQNIVGHPDCALILHAKDHVEDVSAEEFDLLLNIITDYTVRYMDIYRPSRLMVYLGSLMFEIQIVRCTDMVYFAHPEIQLIFEYEPRSFERMLLSRERVMLALSTISLGCIVELDFNSDELVWVNPIASPGLQSMIKSLSSVQMLIAAPYFKLLNSLDPKSPSVLPLLKVIKLKARNPIYTAGLTYAADYLRDVFIFLSQRKSAGVPVLKVDIGDGVLESTGRYDWSFLDNIEGLKIVWRQDSEVFEYICGSGEKRRLDWI